MSDTVKEKPDYEAIKAKQKMAWSAGDYAKVGTTLQIVGEQLCETIDLRPGAKVLDVAAGNGNFTLAASRRFAEVTSTDYVADLLEDGKLRAAAEGHDIAFQVADAEDLPFETDQFDVVGSTFGVMFVANHEKAAQEMLRVCRRGGVIAMSNWTPEGFIGQVFKTIGKHVPPAPGVQSPGRWGTSDALHAMFGQQASNIELTTAHFKFRYQSVDHFMEYFRTWYGPVLKAFEVLGENSGGLDTDLRKLLNDFNIATDGSLVIPSEYVDVVIRKA